MHERPLILAVLFALCSWPSGGCSRGSGSATSTAPTTQAATAEWHRYDDARLSLVERQAVRAATEAVLGPTRPRPDFDKAFRYQLSKTDGEWHVMVWHVTGFKDGEPQFVPGGHTFVTLDQDFKVILKMPGS